MLRSAPYSCSIAKPRGTTNPSVVRDSASDLIAGVCRFINRHNKQSCVEQNFDARATLLRLRLYHFDCVVVGDVRMVFGGCDGVVCTPVKKLDARSQLATGSLATSSSADHDCSLLLALISKQSTRLAEVRWVVAGIAVTLVAMIAMPSGDGWSDMLAVHRFWMGAIITSGLFNLWLLDRMARRGADRWVMWVALAGLGSPTILAASAFAGLAEWFVAAIVATSVFAIAANLQKSTVIWCVLYPVVLFSGAGVAAGRFYTYEEHPTWLYGLMLFAPSVIALVDVPLERRSTVMRVAIALVTSLLVLGCVAWFVLAGSTEEQW